MPIVLPDADDNQSLLQICQDTARAVGFPAPTSVVNNNDATAVQLYALANLEGEQLSKAKNWSELVSEHTFALETGVQEYDLPVDFRWIIPGTSYDRTDQRIILNPLTSQEWQYLKAWTSIAGLTRRARIRAGKIEFEQTITASDDGKTIAFEYLSSYWAESAGGTTKARFSLDSDIPRIDKNILTLGLIWRFRRAKGLDYESEIAEYAAQLNLTKASDGGARKLNMNEHNMYGLVNPNIPDQGFGP